jgi:malonyl CoA-acyl carrier protein transacylase
MQAFIFPGQGTQRKGMGGSLFDEFTELVEQVDSVLGYSIKALCLHDKDNLLRSTDYSQPAIYVVNELYRQRLQRETNVCADYLAGFSLGEYNALLAAGSFDFLTGLKIVQHRGRLMGRSQGGAMAAVVGITETALRDALIRHRAQDVTLANHNTPHQFVLSGSKVELNRLKPLFQNTPGVEMFSMLNTSGAFHSRYMIEAQRDFHEILRDIPLSSLRIPVISNVTARPYDPGNVKSLMVNQIISPVMWTDTIQYLLAQGVETFTEVGVGGVLTRMIDNIRRHQHQHPVPRVISGTAAPLLKTIQSRCAALPDKDLLIFHDDHTSNRINGATLARTLAVTGRALKNCIGPQERVIMLLPQSLHYGLALLSCWYANAVAVPMAITDPLQLVQKKDILDAVIISCGARYVLTCHSFRQAVVDILGPWDGEVLDIEDWIGDLGHDDPPRPVANEDLALLLYTSGSTGQPKGVMINHAGIHHSARSPLWAIDEQSRVVSWLPQFHAFGLCLGLLAPLAQGATSVILPPEQFIADPIRWFQRMDQYEATHTGAPNFAFDYCCAQVAEDTVARLSLRSLRFLVCGGDMINKDAYDRFTRHFGKAGLQPDVLKPNYGLSEAVPVTLQTPGRPTGLLTLDRQALQSGLIRTANQGKVLVGCGQWDPSTRIVIADPETRLQCPPDRIGEIWIKSPIVAQGYFDDPEQTDATYNGMLADTGEAGFFRTGDLGFIADTQLYVVGREKDVIVANGKKHHCADIETTIRSRVEACRLLCAVFATDQLLHDESRVVVVQEMAAHDVPVFDDTARAIVACVSEASHLQIDDVVFVLPGSIPVTGLTKIRRKICRQQYQDGTLPATWRYLQSEKMKDIQPSSEETSELTRFVARLKAQVFDVELGARALRLKAGSSFGELGLDSIQYIRLARRIEVIFQLPFKPGLLFKHNSCEALAGYLIEQANVRQDAQYPRWKAYRDETVAHWLNACRCDEISIQQTLTMIKGQA